MSIWMEFLSLEEDLRHRQSTETVKGWDSRADLLIATGAENLSQPHRRPEVSADLGVLSGTSQTCMACCTTTF